MSSVLLSVENLVKSYGARRAVDGVSFKVRAGQTVGLIGPNGAGKSTTVSMLCGLLRPDAGRIVLGGETIGVGRGGGQAPHRPGAAGPGAVRRLVGARKPAPVRRAVRPEGRGRWRSASITCWGW